MSTRILIALAIAATASAMSSQAYNARQELRKVLHDITVAVQHNDVDVFATSLAPDFTAIQPDGSVLDRARVLQDWKGMMSQMKNVRWNRKIRTITFQAPYVLTVTDSKLSADMAGPDHKMHRFSFSATSEDKWERLGKGKWIDHATKLTNVMALVDGKPASRR